MADAQAAAGGSVTPTLRGGTRKVTPTLRGGARVTECRGYSDGGTRVTQCRGYVGGGHVIPLAVALVALLVAPASAHKLVVFARAEGTAILGKAYFHGGAPAQGLEVTALDPNLREIGRTTTDGEGEFSLEARYRCDHHLLVEAPDGHGTEFVLPAAQLPAELPPRGEAASPGPRPPLAASPPPGHDHEHDHEHDHGHSHAPPPSSGEIAGLRAEVAALREQIVGYEDRTRLRDVLGGIGYILGLAGLAFYFLGVKRKRATDQPSRTL